MNEWLMLGGFAVVNLIGVGFFFGALCQKIQDLEGKIKEASNHLSSIQYTLTDIHVKLMNLQSRLTVLEKKIEGK